MLNLLPSPGVPTLQLTLERNIEKARRRAERCSFDDVHREELTVSLCKLTPCPLSPERGQEIEVKGEGFQAFLRVVTLQNIRRCELELLPRPFIYRTCVEV